MIGFRSRAGDQDLPSRLEALAAAVNLAEDRLDQEAVAFAGHVVTKAEARLRHGTTHTLIALLGATGSGKSSVANALVGADVATTGIRRPTTSSTLACVWGADDAGALLDWLEVVNRHQVSPDPTAGLDGLILLDVPDHDSVALAHREEMERIAEHADVLVWVTDPEKYADKAMHDYLARLSGHGAVMTLVLNKIDLLTPDDVAACRADLGRLLAEPGLADAPIVTLSATTGEGRSDLVDVLAEAVQDKQAAVARLTADTSLAAKELAGELGSGSGPDRVPNKVADRLATDLADASGLGAIADAVAAGHRRDGAKVTGWPFTRWLRRLRPHPLGRLHLDRGSAGRTSLPEPSGVQRARSEGAVRTAAETITRDLPDPWPSHVRSAASPDQQVVSDR
ncbi:MAG: GTPase, partial [Actinomycetota bacterium]